MNTLVRGSDQTDKFGAREEGEEGIVRCHACPVICRIRPGRAGACSRYANEGGALVRTGVVEQPALGLAQGIVYPVEGFLEFIQMLWQVAQFTFIGQQTLLGRFLAAAAGEPAIDVQYFTVQSDD